MAGRDGREGSWRPQYRARLPFRLAAAVTLIGACTFVANPVTAAPSSTQHVTEDQVVSSASALSARERRRIETYLVDQFRSRRISIDLLKIIMKRVDAFATGVPVPDVEEEHPTATTYPSVALQLSWQVALEDIADQFRRDFGVRPTRPANHLDVIMEGLPRPVPDLNTVHAATAGIIEEAQGEISEELRENPLPADFRLGGRPSPPKTQLGKYAVPVRIAPTQIKVIDEAIPQVLAELQSEHQGVAIDEASFPSSPDDANLIIPERQYGGYGRWKVLACAGEVHCQSLRDFIRHLSPQDAAHPPEARFPFLNSIYLTNPYGNREGMTAIVRLEPEGSIVSAYCSLDDIRYSAGAIDRPPLRREELRACIEAALGY